jgi:hypothetical protein
MDWQARTGGSVLVRSRKMTGGAKHDRVGWGEDGQRRQKTKYTGPVDFAPSPLTAPPPPPHSWMCKE